MRPHPIFKNWNVPVEYMLGDVVLKALTINDLERDFNAIMESAADIKAANPSSSWPDGLTLDKNLIDLAWHQREFEARRSFAWIIEAKDSTYLGCLYIYPSIEGKNTADVNWWWHTHANVERIKFREDLLIWLSGQDWPSLYFHLPKH